MTTEAKRGWIRRAAALALGAVVLLPVLNVTAARADPPDWAPAHGWRRHHADWSGRGSNWRNRSWRDYNGSDNWARSYNRDYYATRRARRHFRRRFRHRGYYTVPYGSYTMPNGTYYMPNSGYRYRRLR